MLTYADMQVTVSAESLEALSAYFVAELEYPFHEHVVLDALNALTAGQGQVAAKLAYLVKQQGDGMTLTVNVRHVRVVIPGDADADGC